MTLTARISSVLLFAVAGSFAFAGDETSFKNNMLSFQVPDLQGKTVSFPAEALKGKVVLVDIWGTWCPPCREEIPHLVQLHEKYKAQGLEVIGIAFEKGANPDEDISKVKQFAEKNGIKYTLLYGGRTGSVEKQLPSIQNFTGYPTTVLIGRDGKVAEVIIGFSKGDEKELEAKITSLLAAK